MRKAGAKVDLLVAIPTEVFLTRVAVVRFSCISVHCVCRITLWAPHALALSESQSLGLSVTSRIHNAPGGLNADHAKLVLTDEALSHPLDLVEELEVVFTFAADRRLVHVHNALYVFGVIILREVEKRQQHVQGHNVFAPLSSLAEHQVDRDFLAVLQFLLNGQGDFGLDAIYTGLMFAVSGQYDATFLFDVADGAESVLDGNEA